MAIDEKTQRVIDSLKTVGLDVLKDIDAKKDPVLKIVTRNLNNVYFDEKDQIIKLGDKSQGRYYFNCITCCFRPLKSEVHQFPVF